MAALTLPWGHIPVGVYKHDPPSGSTSHQRKITFSPPSGGNPIIRAYGWMEVGIAFEWGHIPSSGGFLGYLRVGDIRSAWRVDG